MDSNYKLTVYPLSRAVVLDQATGQPRDATPQELEELNQRMSKALRDSMRVIDPNQWHLPATAKEDAQILRYNSADGLPLNSMSHSDLPEGDPLRTLCDENPRNEAVEAVN